MYSVPIQVISYNSVVIKHPTQAKSSFCLLSMRIYQSKFAWDDKSKRCIRIFPKFLQVGGRDLPRMDDSDAGGTISKVAVDFGG